MKNRFDEVSLARDVARQIALAKKSMAEALECLLQEGDVKKEMTVPELISCLKGNVN